MTTMFNYAINNETIQGSIPIPLLTNNPYIGDMSVMGKTNIPKPSRICQGNRRTHIEKGMRFGRLTIIEEIESYHSPGGQSHRKIKAECDCGNVTEAMLCQLTTGKTRSCGCLVKEAMSRNMTTHGHSKHPLFRVWDSMKQRCYNPNNGSFANYGYRGIEVCESWLNDFEAFYEWAIGHGWKKGLVIDKIDNDKGYCPDNCRFVDRGLSGRNKRLLTLANKTGYRGIYKSGKKWAAKILSGGEKYYLGCFHDAVSAAKAYDEKAIELNAGHPLNFT